MSTRRKPNSRRPGGPRFVRVSDGAVLDRAIDQRDPSSWPDHYVMEAAVAVTSPDQASVEQGQKNTHDHVLRQAGTARRSGVVWAVYDHDQALQWCIVATTEQVMGTEIVDQVRAAITEHDDAVLVMGWCARDSRPETARSN